MAPVEKLLTVAVLITESEEIDTHGVLLITGVGFITVVEGPTTLKTVAALHESQNHTFVGDCRAMKDKLDLVHS